MSENRVTFPPMENEKPIDPEQEDRMIRSLLIILASGAILSAVVVATIITVMVSYNFNFLEWME